MINEIKPLKSLKPFMPRDQVPDPKNLCDHCVGKCCRYISIEIDEPTDWTEFDTLRWYLTHEDISIYVEKGTWYVMVHRDCRHLRDDNRCGIYENRPKVCQDHKTDNCEYEDDYDFELIFEHDRQLWEYAELYLGKRDVPTMSVGTLVQL